MDDASRKFWLRIRKIFTDFGMKTVEGDEAFYYLHDGHNLKGMVLSHVDDFQVSGDGVFIDDIIKAITKELTVSKVEHESFRFTGIDVAKCEDGLVVSMEDYVESLYDIKDVRVGRHDNFLLPVENKLYRGFTGKIA